MRVFTLPAAQSHQDCQEGCIILFSLPLSLKFPGTKLRARSFGWTSRIDLTRGVDNRSEIASISTEKEDHSELTLKADDLCVCVYSK